MMPIHSRLENLCIRCGKLEVTGGKTFLFTWHGVFEDALFMVKKRLPDQWMKISPRHRQNDSKLDSFSTRSYFTYLIDRACWNTQIKSWIPVLEIYWSIITSMAFQIILDQYQYSKKTLNYFPVSLSVFQKQSKYQNLSIQRSSLTLDSNNFSKFASFKEVLMVSKIIFSLNERKKLQDH